MLLSAEREPIDLRNVRSSYGQGPALCSSVANQWKGPALQAQELQLRYGFQGWLAKVLARTAGLLFDN